MKAVFVMLVAVGAIVSPAPQKLFFSRVFPVPGQVGLFVAAADGSDERPLLASPDIDYNPAWSPDGRWIAFSSDRGSGLPFAHGRWEHLHLVDIYVIRPDGSGLKRVTEHGNFCGSPKWSSDSLRIVAYCMSAEETLTYRQPRL